MPKTALVARASAERDNPFPFLRNYPGPGRQQLLVQTIGSGPRVRGTMAFEPQRQPSGPGAHPAHEPISALLYQPRLTQPRFPHDEDRRTFSRRRLTEGFAEFRDFMAPPDKASVEPGRALLRSRSEGRAFGRSRYTAAIGFAFGSNWTSSVEPQLKMPWVAALVTGPTRIEPASAAD